jgi:putative ABC transport system ATP-binding protein
MITINELTKLYNQSSTNKVYALSHISLSITEGEYICVMGKSGSGKSTLLHMIGGLDRPTSGKISYDEVEITSLAEKELALFRRKHLGFVFQSFNLVPELTAKENILMPSLLLGIEPPKKHFESIISALSLNDRLAHLPSELSGGQQQRVAIARALLHNPDIVLCDEPTGNLDSASGEQVKEILLRLHSTLRTTMVVVTHDHEFAKSADRVLVIKDGQIQEDAP